MRKTYEAPLLFCEEYVPDTMIASADAKKGHAGNNLNCWGCRFVPGQYDPDNHENDCIITPSEENVAFYEAVCT